MEARIKVRTENKESERLRKENNPEMKLQENARVKMIKAGKKENGKRSDDTEVVMSVSGCVSS